MSIHTNCELCIFAHPSSDKNQCDCGIIDRIAKHKEITVKNNFNYINDYMCRMAFSKTTYDQHKVELDKVDIKQQLIQKSYIRYYLIVDLTSIEESNIQHVCDTINNLTISPGVVSFMVSDISDPNTILDIMRKTIKSDIIWKLHNFVKDETNLSDRIVNIVDINKKVNNTHYLLVIKDTDIDTLETDTQAINSYINLDQKIYHILVKEDHNLYGIFMSFAIYGWAKYHYKNDMNKWISSTEETANILVSKYNV